MREQQGGYAGVREKNLKRIKDKLYAEACTHVRREPQGGLLADRRDRRGLGPARRVPHQPADRPLRRRRRLSASRTTDELDDVAAGLRAGHSLPARWYADPAQDAREAELIFRRSWQYAGRADQVAAPGSYLCTDAGPVPLVLVRDRAGTLRALVNVCRHRGHPVLAGAGRCSTLQCPYHAWTYGLDGGLRKIPRGDREPGLDPGELGLLPASVAAWGPWLFAHPDPDAPPLADVLGELPAVLAGCGVDLDRVAFRRREPWTLACNWKVAIENYLECYHCPVAHPGLSRAIDVSADGYVLRTHPTFSVQAGEPRDPARPRRDRPRPVPLAVAERHAQREAGPAERLARRLAARTAPAGPPASRTTTSAPTCPTPRSTR